MVFGSSSANSRSMISSISAAVFSRSISSLMPRTSTRRRSICRTSDWCTRVRHSSMSVDGGSAAGKPPTVLPAAGGSAVAGDATGSSRTGAFAACRGTFAGRSSACSVSTRRRYAPMCTMSSRCSGPCSPLSFVPLTITGARPPSASMNTPPLRMLSRACSRPMSQPCSTTRLSSPRPMPQVLCRQRTWRGSRLGVSISTSNIVLPLP